MYLQATLIFADFDTGFPTALLPVQVYIPVSIQFAYLTPKDVTFVFCSPTVLLLYSLMNVIVGIGLPSPEHETSHLSDSLTLISDSNNVNETPSENEKKVTKRGN